MAYTPQTWVDGSAGGTPISAARLTNMENGIQSAAAAADSALASSGSAPAVVRLDSFAGSTDDDKLTAALSYAQAQTRVPWIQLPYRDVTFSQTRALPTTGFKIVGAGLAVGPKNLEVSSGKGVAARVMLNVGTGAASWLVGTGSVYDVCLAGIAFQAGNSSAQFLDQATGTLYACEFNNLTLYGFKYGFGSETRKALLTQVVFSGHWTVMDFTDTQFYIGGSDNQLWESGYVNFSPPLSAGAGKAQITLDWMSNTSVGYMYLTCNNDWGGLLIYGNPQTSVRVYGGSFEGMNDSTPATRPLIEVQGGQNTFFAPWLAMVSANANAPGIVKQSGGNISMHSPTYSRLASGNASLPLLYQTGGTAQIHDVTNGYGEATYARLSDGSTVTIPAPSNRFS